MKVVESELKDAEIVLNVGKGTGFIVWYLRQIMGFRGTLLDIDVNPRLSPDVLTSVTTLGIADRCADIVFCCQVLEHLPYSEFEAALKELRRILKPKGKVVLSLPNGGFYFRMDVRVLKLRFSKLYRLPFPRFRHHLGDTQHYWELDRKDYAAHAVLKIIERHFVVEQDFRPHENPYHQFFVGRVR
jgi:predicted SAM-dependent methyltransferase